MNQLDNLDFLTSEYTYKLQEKSRNAVRASIAIFFFILFLLPLLKLVSVNNSLNTKIEQYNKNMKSLATQKLAVIEKIDKLKIEQNSYRLLTNLIKQKNYAKEITQYVDRFNSNVWVKTLRVKFPFDKTAATIFEGNAIVKDLVDIDKLLIHGQNFKEKIESTQQTVINGKPCVEVIWKGRQ